MTLRPLIELVPREGDRSGRAAGDAMKEKGKPWEQIEAFPIEKQEGHHDEAPVKRKIRRWNPGPVPDDGIFEVRDSVFPTLIDVVEMRAGKVFARLCEHARPCRPISSMTQWSKV